MKFKSWLFQLYQREMFFIGQGRNELGKPMGILNEYSGVIVIITLYFGKMIPILIAGLYLACLIGLNLLGRIVVHFGWVRYNQSLNNQQNKELLSIQNDIKRIIRRLDEQSKLPYLPSRSCVRAVSQKEIKKK